jgi:hypothetical protein
MPKTRTRPVTVALFAGGAIIGLAVAAIWGYRALVDRPGHGAVQEDRGAIAAAEKSRTGPPAIVWDRTYGGARIDAARRILPWGRDGFVIAGRTRSKGQGGDDVWLVFLDSEGKETGERLVGSPDFDWLTTMIATRDGGLVLTGSRSDKEITRSLGWVVRLSAKADELWRHEFDAGQPTGTSGLTSIDEMPDGGFIVAGSTTVKSAGQYDGWLLRLDKDGKVVWDRTIGGAEEDALFSVAALPDGGAIATGAHGADGQGWVLRVDAKGATVWEKRLGGSGYDVFNAITRHGQGGFVAVGTTRSKGPAGGAAWVMRLDDKGEPVWERLLTPVKGASANSVLALADGGLLVAGGSIVEPGLGKESEKAWLARLGPDGAVLWTKVFDGTGDQNLFSGLALPDGGFAVAGFSTSKGAGEGDIWVIRLGYK